MREVVENTLVSADGITGSPPSWTGGLFAAEAAAIALRQLERTDAMLMGRATYELFARLWGSPTDPYAQALHDVDKYVFSSTLEHVDWHGAQLVRGGVTEKVRELRATGGGDLLVYGHGGVARELLSAGLVDRLRLWVFPVLVGAGERLSDAGLRQPLELVGTEQLEHGVVVHTYRPGPVTS